MGVFISKLPFYLKTASYLVQYSVLPVLQREHHRIYSIRMLLPESWLATYDTLQQCLCVRKREVFPWQARSSAEIQSQQGESHRLECHSYSEVLKQRTKNHTCLLFLIFLACREYLGKAPSSQPGKSSHAMFLCPGLGSCLAQLGHQQPVQGCLRVLGATGEGGCPGSGLLRTTMAHFPLWVSLCWVRSTSICKRSNPQYGPSLLLH